MAREGGERTVGLFVKSFLPAFKDGKIPLKMALTRLLPGAFQLFYSPTSAEAISLWEL